MSIKKSVEQTTQGFENFKVKPSSLWLPAVLQYSRRNDLEQLLDALSISGGEIDGAGVESVDSEGISILLEGFRKLKLKGLQVSISSPSKSLWAACSALQITEEFDFFNFTTPYPPTTANPDERIGELLVRLGWLENEQLQAAIEATAKRQDAFLGQVLVESDFIDSSKVSLPTPSYTTGTP